MGTQQILLIVLSVVVVGIAVAVGITMFNNQAVNSNRQAVISDLQNLGAQVMAWYRMPASMGGGGQAANLTTGDANGESLSDELYNYIGFDSDGNFLNQNGSYSTTVTTTTIEIVGEGNETGNDGSTPVKATLVITPANESPLQTTVNN
ncbi:MAG TPA: hypothetical protein DHM37_01000 [Candidatus Cloacimonas sp.]|nr:hypothetical protein [Candidatus Cloacimonas sp.]